ncbi:MAG TPA: glycosyltransferase [Terriglobales bacterium]|nr:glycosyltransferase [Terriglobales bacterium]
MIHLFFNAWAASAGAGLTYLRNIVPEISLRNDVRATIAVTPALRCEFREIPNVEFIELEAPGVPWRFWKEQTELPKMVRHAKADVLISTGNFAVRNSPVPQILLSGNSLYTSDDFYRDVWARHDFRAWIDTRIKAIFARRSVSWADVTVAPSKAFADVLQQWTGQAVTSIYHGFNKNKFFQSSAPLPVDTLEKINIADGALKLLFVSHYNYYRNFETLLRAVPLFRDRISGRKVKIFLTCKLNSGENPGSYRAEAASRLLQELDISDNVIELGAIPYHQLHHLYRSVDIYITPAYAETFAHPLVEAMACGLPIVASDTPVHREICKGSAVFFGRFSPSGLAEQVVKVALSQDLADELKASGQKRSEDFSWQEHLNKVTAIAQALCCHKNKES